MQHDLTKTFVLRHVKSVLNVKSKLTPPSKRQGKIKFKSDEEYFKYTEVVMAKIVEPIANGDVISERLTK